MKKRGLSGLSLVVGVRKPSGMSSHDVVNKCRYIFGERRVGHTGTLDPLATGVLPVCIGPAARLGSYLTGHDKRYRVSIAFGAATDTDDSEGSVVGTAEVPSCVFDADFAQTFVSGLVGKSRQMPPAYSAIKVQGKKSYEAAREGNPLELALRDIEVYDARFLGLRENEYGVEVVWDVEFYVSKGTYIRSLARDIGVSLGSLAHVVALERISLGALDLGECVSLDDLADLKEQAALDPLRLLGIRFIYVDDDLAVKVGNGASLSAGQCSLFEIQGSQGEVMSSLGVSGESGRGKNPYTDELIGVVADNKLLALYEYSESCGEFQSRCVFQKGVSRGGDV